MLNHINIMGRLVKDPDLRVTTNGTKVASFRIACDRDMGRDETRVTDFIDIVAWRGTGEFVTKYFRKGMPILISGRLQMREYTNKDDVKVRVAEIIADSVYFCGGDKAERKPASADTFEELSGDDGDLPWGESEPELPD